MDLENYIAVSLAGCYGAKIELNDSLIHFLGDFRVDLKECIYQWVLLFILEKMNVSIGNNKVDFAQENLC